MAAEAPYTVQVDSEQALKLVKAGASLLFLAVPPSTSFGIDLQMFLVGPNFKGLKMVPPGPHFVYYSVASRHGSDTSPITGFFVHVEPSQVIVRCWEPQQERIVKLADMSEEDRFAEGVMKLEFDRHLAPYDLPHHATWQHLSNYVTPTVIDRLQPVGGDITVMAEAALTETGPQTPAENRMNEHIAKLQERAQGMSISGRGHHTSNLELMSDVCPKDGQTNSPLENDKPSSSGRCFYTRLPGPIKRVGMSASELTALNLDKSQALESVLKNSYGGAEDLMLGELQFAFIAFLMGQSLEAFGQWKAIVSLLFGCEESPLHFRTHFFTKFLEVLYYQLKQSMKGGLATPECPTLDESWFSNDIFLRFHFKIFFALIRDAQSIDGDLLHQNLGTISKAPLQKQQAFTLLAQNLKAKRLQRLVESVLGWIFDDQLDNEMGDEYAPVVVSEEDATPVEG